MRLKTVDIFLKDLDLILVTKGDKLLFENLKQDLLNCDYDFLEIILHQLLNGELFTIDEQLLDNLDFDGNIFDAFETLHFNGELLTKDLWQYRITDTLIERLVDYTNSYYYRRKINSLNQ